MNWLILSDCLWLWGLYALSICSINKLTEYDVRIEIEDEKQIMEEGW